MSSTEQAHGSIDSNYSEQKRLVALAQTAYEETAMWAVKAATTKK